MKDGMRDKMIELVDKAKEEYFNDVTDHTETEYIVECLLSYGIVLDHPTEKGDEGVMTIYEFAEGLNGREYGREITPFEEQRAKELGFVVVFGYSDDNAEFRGAYDEEVGCFNGGRVYEDSDKYVDAVWCDGEYAWTYNTNIPHATFDIYEYGEKYCRGIVFEKGGETNA